MSLHEDLFDAVTYHRVADVKRLLEQGADPNFEPPAFDTMPEREFQPFSPLRMVMFRISDSFLDDNGLREFKEIAKLLVQFGADTKAAMHIAENRYGKYNPAGERDLFMQVWDVVAIADMHSGA